MSFEQAKAKVNLYTTTLHVINSGIVKTSKLTYACPVYRGVSGLALPPAFWTPNAHGVRGGIEGAFMSSTKDRAVAMQYAASGGRGIVFEIQQGMIDRGAIFGWVSQYPHSNNRASALPFADGSCTPPRRSRSTSKAAFHSRLSFSFRSSVSSGASSKYQLSTISLTYSLTASNSGTLMQPSADSGDLLRTMQRLAGSSPSCIGSGVCSTDQLSAGHERW